MRDFCSHVPQPCNACGQYVRGSAGWTGGRGDRETRRGWQCSIISSKSLAGWTWPTLCLRQTAPLSYRWFSSDLIASSGFLNPHTRTENSLLGLICQTQTRFQKRLMAWGEKKEKKKDKAEMFGVRPYWSLAGSCWSPVFGYFWWPLSERAD